MDELDKLVLMIVLVAAAFALGYFFRRLIDSEVCLAGEGRGNPIGFVHF